MATRKNTKAESTENSWEEVAWKLAGPIDSLRVPRAVGRPWDVSTLCSAPMDIRFADVSDAATLLRFVQALADYEKMPHAVEVDEKTLADQLASENPPFECLLAEEAGSAVGFALFFHTYSTWRGRRGIWLEDLFVLPEHRRRGIGKRLLGGAVLTDEHELEVVARDAQLDVRRLELVVELERRLGEDVLDPPAEGRLDRSREEFRRA